MSAIPILGSWAIKWAALVATAYCAFNGIWLAAIFFLLVWLVFGVLYNILLTT